MNIWAQAYIAVSLVCLGIYIGAWDSKHVHVYGWWDIIWWFISITWILLAIGVIG